MDVKLGLLVLTVAVGGTFAGLIPSSNNCLRTECRASSANSKFSYRPGQTYVYNYDGSVASRVNGASEGGSGMSMTAVAHIEVITPCEFALRLSNVVISEIDSEGRSQRLLGTEIFRRHLESAPVRFGFQDGLIKDVCPIPGEKPWITNIKRGVLSSFQNNMDNLQTPTNKKEVDITGNCPADYRIAERTYSSITVDRSKDLLACTDRHGYKTAFQATPYRVNSNIQSLPLTKSSHNCRQTFHTSGYLTQVECKEHHVFRPFSKEKNGAITEASHRLVYQRLTPSVQTTLRGNFRRSNLLFEHEKETTTSVRNDEATREVLRKICETAATDVRPETPKLFSELVYKMKQLDTPTLRTLHDAVKNGQVCAINGNSAKKAFHDAVPMTGSIASVQLIADLVKMRVVKDAEADMWLTSLAFIQEPKREMIQSVKDLLSSRIQNQRNYLSTSALIHNYCRHNSQCQNELAIQDVVAMLESKLGENCRVRQTREHDRIIMVLKALGNIGVAPGASRKLGQCAAEKANPIEIRLAALDALKQQPCEAERATALNLFADIEQEDEVRISAYLASMKCATTETINRIKRVLETESMNQVGSFVWTHLTNLMESDDPHKAEIKEILSDVYLQKEYDMDKRKFSRNYEASAFLDSLNTGAKVESNVIWSRKSFVPRSAMMNLTVDLFGHSVNLLEVGGRVEGMEQLLETFFGPNGYFPEKTVMQTLRREKRQVANDKLNRIDRMYDGKANMDNIKGNMYFKVFGSEVGYMDLLNLRSASDFNILDILIKLAQQREVEFKKSVMFLDTSITIPTIVGLPLRLAVNGTASINLGLSGKMDVRRAHPAPRTMDIDGRIRSSAAVQISSLMSIDANVGQTGLKMVTTLHSSTEVDGQFQVQNSEIMVVNINMPRQKQELISIDNKFYTVHTKKAKEQRMTQNERVEEKKCTGDKLVKMLGVELCGELSYPLAGNVREAPFYPMTGPSRMAITLNKRDTHTAYKFEAKMLNERTRRDGMNLYKRTARVSFNTPGSQTDRNLLFDFILDQPNKAMKLQVDTPWKKLGLEGSMVNQPTMKRATLRLNLDEETEYSMRAEVSVSEKPQGVVFYPNVHIKLPQRDPIQLTGNVAYKKPSSVSFNLRLVDLFTTPVKVSGSTTFEPTTKRLNTDMKLECPLVDAEGDGYFEMNPDNHRSRFSLKYTRPQMTEESITLHYKLRNTRTESLNKISVDTSIRNTMYPEMNNKMKWELQKTASHAETTMDFYYGHSMTDPMKHVQASVITNYQVARTRAEIDAVVSFSLPAKNMAYTTRLDHKHHPRMISTSASITNHNEQTAEVSLILNNLSTDLFKVNGAFRAKSPHREIIYRQSIDERRSKEFHHALTLQWQTGRVFTSTDILKKVGDEYSIQSTINCPGQTPIVMNGAVTFANGPQKRGKVMASYEKDGRKYAGQAGYQATIGRSIDVRCDASVEMPGRKHSTDLMLYYDREKTSAGFSYQWIKNNLEKMISMKLGARHRLNPNDMDIAGSVELLTPYPPVEKIAARFQYTAQNQQHNANVGVTWAPQQTVTLEGSGRVIDWRDFQLSGAVNTPFEGYRRMTSSIKSRIQNGALALAVNGQKQDERVDLELSASWAERIAGAFKFRLPNVAHSLQGGFSHTKMGPNGHLVNLNAVWDEQAFSALIKGKVNSLADVGASVVVNTPFPGYQKSEATYQHLYQGRKALGLVQVTFADRTAKVQFNTENRSNYNNRDLFLMAELMTPFRELRVGKVTLKYFDNGARYSSQVQGLYNDFTLGYDLNMNNNYEQKTSAGNLKVNTPIPGYNSMSYTWNHRFTENVMSKNELLINGQKYEMRISGNQPNGPRARIIQGQLTINTPHAEFRNAILNIKYETNPQSLKTMATLAVNGNTAAFSLDATGSRRDRLVCNLNFNVESLLAMYTPYTLKPITASLTFNGQVRLNTLVSLVRYGENKEVRLEGSYDYRNKDFITGSLNINTPYDGFERVSVQIKHERQGITLESKFSVGWAQDSEFEVMGKFEHGNTVTGEIGIKTPSDLMRNFNFQYSHKRERNHHFVHTNRLLVEFMGERVTFDSGATYQGSNYVTAFARFISPFDNYRNMAYSFRTQKSEGRRTTTFDLELRPGKKSEISLIYALRPNLDMSLSIKTPCHHLSSFQAKLKHEQNPAIKTDASFDLVTFSKPLSGSMLFDMKNPGDITFRITATNEIMIELNHKRTRGDVYTTKLTGTNMETTMMVESIVNLDLGRPSVELKIETPTLKLSEASFYTRYNSRERTCALGGNVRYEGQSHNVAVTLEPGRNNGLATVVFNSDTQKNVDYKISYYRRKEGLLYKAGVETTYNGQTFRLSSEFRRQGFYSGKLVLNTPYQGYEKGEISGMWDRVPNAKLICKLNIQTPFYALKGFKIDYDHQGTWTQFEDRATFEYDASISRLFYSDHWKVNGLNRIEGSGRLLTPFKNAEYTSYSVDHTANDDTYVTKTILEYSPGRRAELNNRVTLTNGLDMEMTLTTPADILRNFRVKVDHRGGMQTFTCATSVHYNEAHSATLDLDVRDHVLQTGTLQVTQPDKQPIRASLTQSYTDGIAEQNFNLDLSNGKNIKYAFNLDMTSGLEANFDLETTFEAVPMIKINMMHTPQPLVCKFTTEIGTKRGPITLRSNFNMNSINDLKFSTHFTSPYENMREYSLSYGHQYVRKTSLNAAASVGFAPEKVISTSLEWTKTSGQNMKAILRLNTPFERIRSFVYTNEKIQSSKTVMTEVQTVDWNDERVWRREFRVNGLNDISYEEDHPYYKNRFTSVKQNGIRTNKWSTTWPGEERGVNIEITYRLENPMMKIKLQTPLEYVYDTGLILTASTNSEYRSEGTATYEITSNLFTPTTGNAEWNMDRKEIKVGATTPFTDYETLGFDLKLSNTGFESNLQYSTAHRITATGSFTGMTSFIKLTATTPFDGYENLFTELSHSGDLSDFNVEYKIQYKSDRLIASKLGINYRSKIDMETNFSLETPYEHMEKTEFIYKHLATRDNIQASAEIKNIEGRAISVTLTFKPANVMEGSLVVRTPFENFEEQTASFKHEGHARQFKTEAKMVAASGRTVGFKVDASLYGHRRTLLTTTIMTPMEGWETLNVELKHMGTRGSVDTSVTYTDSSNGRFHAAVQGSKSPISGEFKIECPYGSILLKHRGDASNFETTGDVTYPGSEPLKVKIGYTSNPRLDDLTLTLESPWTEMTITHSGHREDFTTTVMSTVRGVRRTAEVKFRLNPTLSFNVQYTSPKYSAQVTLGGEVKNFRGVVSASWGRENQKVELNWSLRERIAAGFKISGTIRRFEMITASFSHMDDGTTLSTSVNAQWTPTDRVASALNYKREPRKTSAELIINTPFENYRELRAGGFANGVLLNFQSGANIVYRDDKRIDANLDYNHKETGEFRLKTPFEHVRDVKLDFKKARVDSKPGYTITAQWTPTEAIQMKMAGQLEGDIRQVLADAYLEINTPIGDLRNLVLKGVHRHSPVGLDTTVKAEYNHDLVFHTVFDLEYTDNSLKGHTSMIHPLPLKLNLDLEATERMKKADVELDWDTRDPRAKIKVTALTVRNPNDRTQTISLILPSRIVSLKNEYIKTGRETKAKSTFAWDEQRDRKITLEAMHKDTSRGYRHKAFECSGRVSTPVRTLETKLSHEETGVRYVSEAELSWDLLRAPEKKIQVVAVAEIPNEQECSLEVTIKPPRTHEIKFRHEAKKMQEEIIFWTKNTFSYSPVAAETLTLTYDVRDNRVGRHHNYSSEMTLSHPASNIKLTAMGHFGASYRSRTAGMKLGYMQATGEMATIHLLADIDTEDNKGRILMFTPLRSVQMFGRLTKDRYGYKVDQETIFDGQRVWWSFDLNKRNSSMLYKLHYDHANPSKAFKLHGWYLPREAVLSATHEDGSNTELWGLVSARLNSTNVLHTRLHWKPELVEQIKEECSSRCDSVNTVMRDEYNTVRAALTREATRRRELLTVPDMSLTTNAITAEASSFKADYQMTMNTLEEMMNNNEFFLQDASEVAQQSAVFIADRTRVLKYQLGRAMTDFRRTMNTNLAAFKRAMKPFWDGLEDIVASMVLKFRPAWQSYAYAAITSAERTHRSLAHGWERLQEQVADNNAAIARYFDDRFDFISYKLTPFWEQWTSLPDNVFSAEERNFFARLQEKIREWVEQVREKMDTFYSRMHDRMLIIRDKLQEKFDAFMAKVMEYRAARVLINYAKQVYYHAVDAWEAWEVPETLRHMVETLYRQTKAQTKEYLARVMKRYMRVENSGFTKFDPENGEIRAAIFLPLEIEQFDRLPKIDLAAVKQAWKKLKERYMPQSDYSIWDTYYKYKPSSNPLDWIPPFKAHAMLAHGKHYTTFDGKHYDFASAGTCSYVLARDFIDGNFTVIANYRSGRIHSMMVMSNGKNVEIYEDYKVTIDDHRKELPVQFDNTTVTRQGYRVRVHNEKGVTVTCDMYNRICTTNVTGWYFGKTAGLFGTYNNEQDDEFLKTDRRTTDDVNDFTRTWEVGHECSGSRNAARVMKTTSNPEIQQRCENYFKNPKSIFRPCFKQVDPAAFLDICISDLQQDTRRVGLKQRACEVAAIYRAQCKLAGVDMSQDANCITCDRPDRGTFQGSVTVDNIPEKKADVVILVEEKPCNRDVVNRLESIVTIIDNNLKAKGMRNSRFAVMGFGGNNVHDAFHSHTVEGQLFNEARKIRAAVRTLDFSKAGDNDDVLAALYSASQLSFRSGASKSIVLIPCSECKAETIGYAALQQILTESAIHLHVMAEHDFTLRVANSPKTNYLFGIDKDAAYTMYHVSQRQLDGDVHLHRQVIMPKTLCGALALSQNGSIFNIQKLTEGRSRAQKSFVEIFARRVAKSAEPLPCQVCDCVQDEDGVGKSVCRSCHMTSYNTFLKKIFPTIYQHKPWEAYAGTSKAEQIPLPVPNLRYEEVDQ